jgi:hypothetical protein
MRDGRLVDAASGGQFLLGKLRFLSEGRDPFMDWPLQTTPLLLFHVRTVDRRSTDVNTELPTDSPMPMQPSDRMGDSRHKKPPPTDEEEEVTPALRAQVLRAFEINMAKNALSEIAKGEPGYLISNRADLADAIGTDKTMVNKIIGPARETSKVKLVDRSAFVGRIRKALDLPGVTKIAVKTSRAEIVRLIADLPDEEFAVFEAAVADAVARARKKK